AGADGDDPGHGRRRRTACGPHRAVEGLRSGRLRLLYELPEQERRGPCRIRMGQPCLHVEGARAASADRWRRRESLEQGVRRLLRFAAAGLASWRLGLPAEYRDPESRVAGRALASRGGGEGYEPAAPSTLGRVSRGSGPDRILAGTA